MILYNVVNQFLKAGISIASRWKPKAKAWIEGRRELFALLDKQIRPGDRIIWMHCASAGELEQGKSLIESLKSNYPQHRILISFFSPSGYAAGLKYQQADIISYLPLDTKQNAKRFYDLVKPELVIFIKYEYWYHHIKEAHNRNIPLLLVSAIFRKEQAFFKWWGSFYRQILKFYSIIFVQDEQSAALLKPFALKNVIVSGDTRFDRVLTISQQSKDIAHIEEFLSGETVIVAGSTWKEDEELLADLKTTSRLKLIIAPHEINEAAINRIKNFFPGDFVLYSQLPGSGASSKRVLIIDNYGMLSRLYKYGDLSYVGGGFNKSGIHNTLEAAVWGKPVFFGPNYQKFREARELIASGAAFSVSDAKGLNAAVNKLLTEPDQRETSGQKAKAYVEKNAGATKMIVDHIQRNRLLTT